MKRAYDRALRLVAAGTCVAFVGATAAPAWAYNHEEHQNIVELAYQAIRVVANEPVFLANLDPTPTPLAETPPADASFPEWEQFLADVDAAFPGLLALDSGLPPPRPSRFECGVGFCRGPLGALDFAPSTGYMAGDSSCSDVSRSKSDSFLNDFTIAGDSDFAGKALGLHAARIDDEFDDTHLWWRPTIDGILAAIPIVGPVIVEVRHFVESVVGAIVFALLVPFVCLGQAIAGDAGNCLDDAQEIAGLLSPTTIEGAVPGLGDVSDDDTVGLWHFLHVDSCATNTYDDVRGMLYSEAGPQCLPGAVDLAVGIGLGQLVQFGLNHDRSNGPKRYEFRPDGDGHSGVDRDRGQWQSIHIGLTPFSPVDNLAFYGWQNFRTERSAKWLGWPLHALGDVSVPMHVVGTTGYGHRPYEDATGRFWREIIPPGGEFGRTRAIVQRAFQFRKLIVDWRAAHPGRAFDNDVPIRDLVMALALKTRANSNGANVFHELRSADYLVGDKTATAEAYHDSVDFQREQVLLSAAATLAFLVSAAELPPATLPDPGPVPASCAISCLSDGKACGADAINMGAGCCAPLVCNEQSDERTRCESPATTPTCKPRGMSCTDHSQCCAPSTCNTVGNGPNRACEIICGANACTGPDQCCTTFRCDLSTNRCVFADPR